MRTRNAETPKSGAKKTPAATKKEAAAADKTPEAAPKSTPKTTPKAKAAAKQSTPKAAPTPEPKVEEMTTPVEEKKPVATPVEEKKPVAKKTGAKNKSPLAGKASAAATPPKVEVAPVPAPTPAPEETPALKAEEEEIKEAPQPKAEEEEMKEEPVAGEEPEAEVTVASDAKDDADSNTAYNEEAGDGDQKMEEGAEMVAPEETGDVEVAEEEAGDDEEAAAEEEEAVQMEAEVEEQMQISDMAKARKIKKEREIFVGGLDRDAVEEDLKKAFQKVGEVVEVRLHRDFTTNKNKGYAFVKFASKEQAERALIEIKNPVIRDKRCGIAPSEDNDTLFLGNICNTWTKEAIRRKLKDYGIDAVESITLVADTQNEGLSRGFAFLEFACHADAMLAYKRLQKPDVIFGHHERTAKVAFAEPLREPDPEVMAQVKSVFVDGLPPYWDEDRVKEQFKSYGEIERVVLARNMSSAKRNDFGFVNFTTHEAAVACVEGVNNIELGDGKSKLKARARLANPLPKTQAVKGGMSGGFRIGHSGIGIYPRFGRGFGRGRFPSYRVGFQGGRGFHPRGRGRSGRFSYVPDDLESPAPEFQGWRPYGPRGGRMALTSGRRGGFDRGRGRDFPSRRQPFPAEGDFGGPFGARYPGEDPYFYGDGGHGVKRPFSSMMEHDSGYLEPVSRLRPRYDHPDPLSGGTRYRDSLGMSGLYSQDYYGAEYGGSGYSSYYGGEPSGSGYYY